MNLEAKGPGFFASCFYTDPISSFLISTDDDLTIRQQFSERYQTFNI
jgi:hypothetical protein